MADLASLTDDQVRERIRTMHALAAEALREAAAAQREEVAARREMKRRNRARRAQEVAGG